MKHPIPDAALDDRLGFIGTAGSGKTYNAGGAIERLLGRKARVVIVDPLGVWWGLRLLADGKAASPYDVVIFGGPHGDLPLNEHAGALIGETAATMAESCIVDLSQLGTKASDRRFMTAFLETIYRKAPGEPFHLVVDEADLFAPQKPPKGDETLLNLMEQIVRRGRIKGFIPWLITQRPAVINKNVLSQVDGLIAFKLTGSHDRDALDSWIEGQADKAQGKAIKDSLPAMPVGQGVVWVPGRGVLDTVQFPQKITFDSSRTPKRGEKKKRTAALKPLDLGALKDKLATVEAETKANDPKKLRAELAKANKRIADLERKRADAVMQVVAGPDAEAKAEQRGYERGLVDGDRQGFSRGIADGFTEATKLFDGAIERLHEAQDRANNRIGALASTAARPVARPALQQKRSFAAKSQQPSPQVPPGTPRYPNVHSGDGQDRPLGAEKKPLGVLAQVYPAGMTEAQWAVASGIKRSGGTWSTYRSRLVTSGRVEKRADGIWFITDQGLDDLGETPPPLPAPGLELVEYWAGKISGVGPMLRRLAAVYPNWLDKEQLAADLDMAASGGTFSTYISRLRAPGLIEVGHDKRLRAAEELME